MFNGQTDQNQLCIQGFDGGAEALHKELNYGSTYIITGAQVKPIW